MPKLPKDPRSFLTGPIGKDAGEKVRDQVQRQAGVGPVDGGGGTLFTEPVLVVNQKTKLIELANEHEVFDQHGNRIGSIVEVDQSQLKMAARLVTSLDQFFTHTFEIRDASEQTLVRLVRPRKLGKSRFELTTADGTEIGEIKQKNMLGKIRFHLSVGGKEVGQIKAENWRAWDFHVVDAGGTEVARITKTFEGVAKTLFTTADNFVVQIHRPLDDPLRTMVVAAALCIDTALKQDDRGLN
ncbi:MAG: LURP-one-related/scramblase family protein [Actinomycetota bacterium]